MHRPIELNDELADGFAFDVHKAVIKENLSEPFEGTITLISPRLHSDLSTILGQHLSLTFHLHNLEKRYFHGIIQSLNYREHKGRYHYYEAIVVPYFGLLKYNSDCRIFQDLTVPQIVDTVLKEHGELADINLVLTYPTRVYCTQYRESQFDFIDRLLREEGIYYHFVHTATSHTLVLCDYQSFHQTLPVHPELDYLPSGYQTPRRQYHVSHWQPSATLQTGGYRLTDYRYTHARHLIDNVVRAPEVPVFGNFERYDYVGPEQFANDEEGRRYAILRLEADQCRINRVSAQSNAPGLQPGYLLSLKHTNHSIGKQSYLILTTTLTANVSERDSGASNDGVEINTQFTVMPNAKQYRPEFDFTQSKRRVAGPQTAVVVGPEGEEIYTDHDGRVKCHFHWDHRSQKNAASSCWIRVSQNWGGNGWGHIALPRIGQEVIVDFLEGDPDQPIITGRAYNSQHAVPHDLPAHKTRMSIKSKTYRGNGFNELRFDDATDAEEVFIHAQKDQNNVVLNNETTQVGVDRTENVGNNETITIGGDRSETVQKNELHTIALTRTHNIGINDMLNVGGANEVNVGGFRMINVALYQNRNTGLNLDENVGKNHSTNIGNTYTLEAGDEIILKTGKSSLTMKKDGTIVLQGKDIIVNGSGKIDMKAKKNFVQKGKKILEN